MIGRQLKPIYYQEMEPKPIELAKCRGLRRVSVGHFAGKAR
jgi:hypothetical protein